MAELDAVSSGIGFASLGIQILDSFNKLKDFWDLVQDTSIEIAHLMQVMDF
ncbi:hypothetical protein GQ43DRAFT_335006, partial [Delitschia confertaspora ATCC 74209]